MKPKRELRVQVDYGQPRGRPGFLVRYTGTPAELIAAKVATEAMLAKVRRGYGKQRYDSEDRPFNITRRKGPWDLVFFWIEESSALTLPGVTFDMLLVAERQWYRDEEERERSRLARPLTTLAAMCTPVAVRQRPHLRLVVDNTVR
jgi:hypothetical protein